jgi:Domain of unknown function (DUF4265)
MSTVRLLVEIGRSGRPVHEDVPAEQEGDKWRLLASPGLVMGTAAGDLLEVYENRDFDVVERGQNIAVHVATPAGATAELDQFKAKIERMGGWCDGIGWTRDRTSALSVFTIPFHVGFEAIEAACNEYEDAVPTGEWYYANIYDPTDDETPLNWWLD